MFSTLLESVPANDEKTEIMPLGDNILQEKDFPTHSNGEVIKILGIYLGYVGHSIYDLRKMSNMFKLLYSSPWKTIQDKLLFLPIGGRFVLHCNFQTSKLKINLPAYYKECFDAWSEVNGKTPSCYEEIINEISGTTNFFVMTKISMYRGDIVNLGFMKVRDLISANNSCSCDFSSLTNSEQRFFLTSVINSIPAEWRSLIKASTNVTSANPIPLTPTIKLPSGNVVPILDISPKQIYQIFLQQKQIAPTAKQKLSNKYSNIDIDWEKVYTLAFQCTLDTKIREFHYKILNCIIFTNVKLNLIGVVESPNCTFCQEAAESVEHLPFSCRISSEFWKHVLSWLRDSSTNQNAAFIIDH